MADVDKTKLNEIERAVDAMTSTERNLGDTYTQFARHIDGFPTMRSARDKLDEAMLMDRKVVSECVRRFQKCSENLAAGKKLTDIDRELKDAKGAARKETEKEHDALVSAVAEFREELKQLDRDAEKLLDIAKREFNARLDGLK